MVGKSIKELYNAEKYSEIITLWQEEETRTQLNDWDRWYVLNSFNKLNRHRETIEAYRLMRKNKGELFDPEPWQRIENTVGWAVYYVHIKGFNPESGDVQTLFSQVDYIVKHCQKDAYSPLIRTVLLVTKLMKDGQLGAQPDYKRMCRYLSTIDPTMLSMKENQSSDGKPYASDRELWYMRKAKALLETKQYSECIACVSEALRVLAQFHNNDDAWLRMYSGDCFFALGQMDQASNMYQEVLIDLQNPSVYLRLFQLEAREGHPEQAMLFGARCGFSAPFKPEQDDKRIRFYRDFADYLILQNMEQEALLHRRHSLHIYAANPTWKAPTDWEIPEELMRLDRNQTAQRLKACWKKMLEQYTQWENGRVERLFPGNKAGLLEDDQHFRIYFSVRDYMGNRQEIVPGLRVRFAREMRRNHKKRTVEPSAVLIEKRAD